MILYIKNIISLVNFFLLKILFRRRNNPGHKNVLFFNSEKIGDIVVSSMILENDTVFPDDVKVYFLLKEKFSPLFKSYTGKFQIIKYNYKAYKWILPYRIKLIKKIRSLNLDKFYNLTPARGVLNDELSILSGANKIYAMNGDKKYLKCITGDIMDKGYTEILYKSVKNEYVKHTELIKSYSGEKEILFKNKKTFVLSESNELVRKGLVKKDEYIAVSPLSSEPDRMWGTENFKNLCNELAENYKVVLIGSLKEITLLQKIRNKNENIFIDTSALSKLPEIIYHCRLFIGGDSGLTHIALKLGKPLLAILDGGYFNRYFPYRTEDKNNNYIYSLMDCFECGFDCIYDRKYCLLNITYESVKTKVKEILKITI
jgi:ADP-heptose:LPS heptosyltransferase